MKLNLGIQEIRILRNVIRDCLPTLILRIDIASIFQMRDKKKGALNCCQNEWAQPLTESFNGKTEE